jgi:pyridoxine kinase
VGILSFQSRVVYGHVGHSAAVFLLQRLGFEVWPVDTVCLSNHPGHPTVRGRTVPAVELRALVEGVEERGALDRCEAVLSGYLGAPETAEVVEQAVARVKAARPDALFCCDPVMGDAGKPLYVASGLPTRFRERLVPAADIVTPNAVELAHLTGRPAATTTAEALAAAGAVRRRGPRVVVVTGLREGDGATVATIAVADGGAWVARSRRRDRPTHGAGDAFTAVFLAAYLRRRDVPHALARAVGALEAILDASGGDAPDLAVVAAGDRVALGPEAPVERLG